MNALDIDFNSYANNELYDLAFDHKFMMELERGDMINFIHMLARRLDQETYQNDS